MKLLIISVNAGAKIACRQGMGNYYTTSDGLKKNPSLSLLFIQRARQELPKVKVVSK